MLPTLKTVRIKTLAERCNAEHKGKRKRIRGVKFADDLENKK